MNKAFVVSLAILFISLNIANAVSISVEKHDFQTADVLSNLISVRNPIEDVIVIPDNNPLFGIIGSYISCWYDTIESTGLKPMLVQHEGYLTNHQEMFIDNYLDSGNSSILVLGKHLHTAYNITEMLGLPPGVA
ncbi:MAG: hypothetical protein KAJ44_03735, partial [Thermoplasmatales archaeon]|nr:hypothetical protein [Thermoplasmatales archaeon]